MEKFLISASFNLLANTTQDQSEYIRRGLEFYRDHGFDAAEIDVNVLDLSGDGWRSQVEDAIVASQELGVRFTGAHLPFVGGGGMKDAAFMEAFDRRMHASIDAMARLGVSYAVLHPNGATVSAKDFNRRAQYDTVMSHLSPYVEHAMRVGLPVVLENMRIKPAPRYSHRYCQEPDELCEVADALGIGVCWDFGHANISGLRQSEALAYVGGRLRAVHVNDNTGIDDDHTAPFSGTVDWKDAMHGLKLAGYKGTFNYEVKTVNIPAAMRPAFADYLFAAAHELISYIED